MKQRHERTAIDAVRLLCYAIQKVQYFDKNEEGFYPGGDDPGEFLLQDALEFLAWGDTHNARKLMDEYDTWRETGHAPWPHNGEPAPDMKEKNDP